MMSTVSLRPSLTLVLVLAWLVSGCASEPHAPDGVLDCAEDETWFEQGSVLPGTVGSPTPEEALAEVLNRFQERLGGEILVVTDSLGSLVVDGREEVVGIISEAPAGGWIVTTVTGCGPYEG
jgi:hypothetical protein